ncbi:MAG TPA: hypothetical protein PKX28_05945 [Candidatus Hydrogenedentes bacterium]|nr:hypothetical protein [Candidatus Hydrogenedentota bacterium]HOJ67429.1 hypothetical protein [Candidatus Hydrogenedentota bacterium]HOK89482.1 hypothetical protein [Candidatus Hydrogenedentota bacterium]HPO30761.1 hypothetical protein [Candidatus Hydrogenedentota bacterium]
MIWCVLILVLAQPEGATPVIASAVPEGEATFKVTLSSGGGQDFYAGIRVDGAWAGRNDTSWKPTENLELVPDMPGSQVPMRVLARSVQSVVYEAPVMRRERWLKYWQAMGYVLYGEGSQARLVYADDLPYAERARAMAVAAAARRQEDARTLFRALDWSAGPVAGSPLGGVVPWQVYPAGGVGLVCLVGAVLALRRWRQES